jgi:anti-sigma regulatory factor (Ser/Thr protein kinase)
MKEMSANRQKAATYRLPSDADAPRTARDAAAAMLSDLGCGYARSEDLALVVSELVTNAVVHGVAGELELRLEGTPTMIRVEVADGGTAEFEWPPDSAAGHWGLNLVSIFSERSGVTREPSTCVWCELDLDAPAAR